MSEPPEPRQRVDYVARASMYIGIVIFAMQVLGQYSLYVSLPEKVKVVLDRLDTLESYGSQGKALHAANSEAIKALRHDLDQREEAHRQMAADDRTQWDAIRQLDRRVDQLEKKE